MACHGPRALGYVSGNWLFFATGGMAFAHGTRSSSISPGPGSGATVGTNHTGWTVGAGVEWAFAPKWTTKLEYKYVDLGAPTYPFAAPGTSTVDIKLHTVQIGLNYRF